MKIRCIHGYFMFEELEVGQVSTFMGLFGVELVALKNYFTFKKLQNAKAYSIIGGTYLGVPATKTFEGKPWELMRENKLVYHFNSDLVVPIDTILDAADVQATNSYFVARGLIIPGSVLNGVRVKSYTGFYLFDQGKFQYSEISNE